MRGRRSSLATAARAAAGTATCGRSATADGWPWLPTSRAARDLLSQQLHAPVHGRERQRLTAVADRAVDLAAGDGAGGHDREVALDVAVERRCVQVGTEERRQAQRDAAIDGRELLGVPP